MKLLLVSVLLLVLSTLTADGAAVDDISGDALKPGARGDLVYDISGKALKPGIPYYITSAIRGAGGGGLFPLARPKICPRCRWCCPLNVAQESSDLQKGLPVFVYPIDSSKKVVHLLTDEVKIQFTAPPADGGSPIWRIGEAESNGYRYVTLNGNPNNAIDEDNYFRIDKLGTTGYQLLYCPIEASGRCGSLGIISENGKRWLFLTPEALGVVFVKA